MNDKENIKTNRPSPFENTQKPQSFDTQAINDVTQTSGVIPASTVTAPQPTLVVPEINMKESAPMANQAIQSAQAQVQEQTNLQTLTDQRIVDQQKQFAEQESLAQTIGGGGDLLRNEFSRGQEVLKPIEKDIQDLNSLINQKTRSIQNQLLDEEGRVVPKAFVTGRQAIIQQRGTAELSSLGALLDAKNGMLETAQGKLKLSMELFVAVNKAEVAEKEARVNLLKDITGVSQDEEQKEVDKLQAESDKFEEERDAISSIALQAMQSGAGADEIQRITQSKSEDEAIGNATSLGRMAKLDAAIKNGQLSAQKAQRDALGGSSREKITVNKQDFWQNSDGTLSVIDLPTKITSDDINKSLSNFDFIQGSLDKALELSGGADATNIGEWRRKLVSGSTKRTRLEAITNSIRTNVLTLLTDPSVKDFFGPQMSEADVLLMTAGGTTLNPELQSSEDLESEIGRLNTLVSDIRTSVEEGQKQRENQLFADFAANVQDNNYGPYQQN